jgi:predicted glycoside hydrolase/deacetylase ChbG (UPF0249 family)
VKLIKIGMKNKIIINADDFGLKSSVNKAIVESFNKGLINSTTLMANMPGFEEAVELIHNQNLVKKIGVHLVLTDGLSLTQEIKSFDLLFNKKVISSPLRFKKLFFLDKHERIVIYNEYSAQIEKVRRNGISITHLDTHHQIHDMWAIMQIMIDLLKTYNIPSIRILNNLNESSCFYKNAYRNLINHYLKVRKANFTEFLGNQLAFLSILEKNPSFFNNSNKRIEIMVHPDLKENGLLIDKIGNNEYDFRFPKDLETYFETF